MESVSAYYWTALDCRSYCLSTKFQPYDDDVASRFAKMARQLQVQLKSQMFEGSDPISILDSLPTFQIACNTNGIHKDEEMGLFHFFMKKPAGAALNARN